MFPIVIAANMSRTNKKSIKQANEQHQNAKAMRKTRPVVTKTLNFHFWATIWHVLVIWSASSCARIWKDFPNKTNDDFVTVLKWDGVNCNIIQICHFMASNETGFELCLRCMTSIVDPEFAIKLKFNCVAKTLIQCTRKINMNLHHLLKRFKLASLATCRVHFPSDNGDKAEKTHDLCW